MTDRKYVRHPTDIPIVYEYDRSGSVSSDRERLKNISFGGLAFEAESGIEKGAILNVTIPLVDPDFHIRGRVAWCEVADGHYDVGVEFIEPDKLFKARMLEQVCQIEHYKRQVLEDEGRALTGEQAAFEWIKAHAVDFPSL
jgi:PilZ domain